MEPTTGHGLGRAGLWLATLATVAALRLGREIAAPLALAGLLGYLLLPLAKWLERWKLPRGVAATTAVLCLAGVLVASLAVVAAGAVDLSSPCPPTGRTSATRGRPSRAGPSTR